MLSIFHWCSTAFRRTPYLSPLSVPDFTMGLIQMLNEKHKFININILPSDFDVLQGSCSWLIISTGMTSSLKVMQIWGVIYLAFVDQMLQYVLLLPNEYQNTQTAVWAYLFIYTHKSCILGRLITWLIVTAFSLVSWLKIYSNEITNYTNWGCIIRKGSEHIPYGRN